MSRLSQYLAEAGINSRRKSARLVQSGRVSVNGKTITDLSYQVKPDTDTVSVDGKPVTAEKKQYIAFYKPKGIVCTRSDAHNTETVMNFFVSIPARIYPVGRLDKDSEGLLIMTNDGYFCNAMTHPRYHQEKEYETTVTPVPNDSLLKRIEKGIVIEGYKTRPCTLTIMSKTGDSAVIRVKLSEGRKRQIRLMFRAIGCTVTRLVRIRIGGLTIKGMKPGTYTLLTTGMLSQYFGYET